MTVRYITKLSVIVHSSHSSSQSVAAMAAQKFENATDFCMYLQVFEIPLLGGTKIYH